MQEPANRHMTDSRKNVLKIVLIDFLGFGGSARTVVKPWIPLKD